MTKLELLQDLIEYLLSEKEAELAEALDRYTDPLDPEYDPAFTKQLRELRPDWFEDDVKH